MKFPDEAVFHPQELRHFGVAMETNPELLNNLLSIKWQSANMGGTGRLHEKVQPGAAQSEGDPAGNIKKIY